MPWSRKWQPTPVFLPGRFYGQRSLVGYTVHGVTKRHNWVTEHTHIVNLQCYVGFRFTAKWFHLYIYIHQIRSVTQSCPTLCDPMNRSMPGLPVHHQLLEFTQTHIHRVSDAIQTSHPLSSPSPAPNPSQHQSLFQWVNSSHEVAKVLEFQL